MVRHLILFLVIQLLILKVVNADKTTEESEAEQARSQAEFANFKRRYDLCRLPLKTGNCGHGVKSWYYNHTKNQCVKFIYSLCGGNQNRFYEKKECENFCKNNKFFKADIDIKNIFEEPKDIEDI